LSRTAFLSGCETSRGGDVLTDEAVSIAASVQLAGFPHVIGSLWPISDLHAPAVAEEVYTVLTAGGTRSRTPMRRPPRCTSPCAHCAAAARGFRSSGRLTCTSDPENPRR
jgi:hypothetical protein